MSSWETCLSVRCFHEPLRLEPELASTLYPGARSQTDDRPGRIRPELALPGRLANGNYAATPDFPVQRSLTGQI